MVTGIRDSSEKLVPQVHASQAREPRSGDILRVDTGGGESGVHGALKLS